MQIRRVVGHEVDDHPQVPRVRGRQHPIEGVEVAEERIDVGVVGHVVSEVAHRRAIER
jgi:hypothetical protein